MQRQVLILGDINAYNFICNFYYRQNINIILFENVIKSYELIINNDIKFFTHPSSPRILIIDLNFTNLDLSAFHIWEILEKYSFLSNHKLILIEWEDKNTQNYRKI